MEQTDKRSWVNAVSSRPSREEDWLNEAKKREKKGSFLFLSFFFFFAEENDFIEGKGR